MNINELLDLAIQKKASDLHISAGLTPLFRIDGVLNQFDLPVLSNDDVLTMIHAVMNEQQRDYFKTNFETDFSFGQSQLARFRINAFQQERGAAAAFRLIPTKILSMDDLNLPTVFHDISQYAHGLVLVTGPTGSGKTTTLAAVIDYLNQSRQQHILTIEDPIEFLHPSKSCLVNQREVHRDTKSFAAALRSALREDPDIILVGELRDLETIQLALTAAETGHLVFGTLHTSSATKTIDRIIDVFPGEDKAMIRSMLSESLRAVIAQQLLPKIGGGRIASFEIMICNAAIRNLIRENKVAQMYSILQTGASTGMQTLDQYLTKLVKERSITAATAKIMAVDKSLF